MPYLGDNTKARLARVQLPGDYAACVDMVRGYMARTDTSAAELAERCGKGRSTINLFIQGRWAKHKEIKDWTLLAAHLVEYIERNPVEAMPAQRGRMFETENYRRISTYFRAAVLRGQVCLLYGPPGTQKSFVLQSLVAQRNREKKNDAIFVYASQDIKPLTLLKRIGRGAGVLIGWHQKERILDNLLHAFLKTEIPPAVIIDEAQHLRIETLEILRELQERTGCGLVLAGSHNLFENFLKGRAHLEQWISRIDHKEPLPGLLEKEVHEIAERELGRKLSEKQERALTTACEVDDIFARTAEGKPATVKYYSVRRLVKVLAQMKETREAAA